jgi:S-formylglutathione hydrolase
MSPLKSHKTFNGLTQFWEHDSVETKTKMKFATFTPSKPPIGALIFLSGLTCTDENFITKAGAQKFLEEARLMVVCPDTSPRGLQLPNEHDSYDFGSGAGFYLNATTPGYRDHYRMDAYVTNELHSLIQKEFKIPANKMSISGHSMGGHGALVLGLSNPDKFVSISAFSPIVNPIAAAWGEKAFAGYLGNNKQEWAKYDATELVKSGKRAKEILIDQGSADEFLEKQLLTPHFAEACKAANQPAKINYREGYDHSYYFISSFVADHVAFHAAALSN